MILSIFNSDFNSKLNDLSDVNDQVYLLVNTLNEGLAQHVPIKECNFNNSESDSEWDLPEHPSFTNDQQVIFSSEVILKKLKDLNINKSPGPDSINSRILVELVDSIAPSLSIIFQN